MIPKSRYGSADLYLSDYAVNRQEYSDIDVPFDEDVYDRLIEHGDSFLISQHASL